MIKVGDKFNLNNENWEVIFIDSDAVVVARSENGEEGIVSQRTIYKNWYEQQKQRADELEDRISEEIRKRFQLEDRWRKAYERADELEKRWSELKKTLLLYKDRKSTRLNSSHSGESRMPSSA